MILSEVVQLLVERNDIVLIVVVLVVMVVMVLVMLTSLTVSMVSMVLMRSSLLSCVRFESLQSGGKLLLSRPDVWRTETGVTDAGYQARPGVRYLSL